MKNTIFYSKASSSDNNDLLLLTGDSQPENPDSEYLLIEQILDIAAKFNTKKTFTMTTCYRSICG
jgi:proteasome assembly chaperone (PAC2) family protein